jgi:hypothetical protein
VTARPRPAEGACSCPGATRGSIHTKSIASSIFLLAADGNASPMYGTPVAWMFAKKHMHCNECLVVGCRLDDFPLEGVHVKVITREGAGDVGWLERQHSKNIQACLPDVTTTSGQLYHDCPVSTLNNSGCFRPLASSTSRPQICSYVILNCSWLINGDGGH